MNMAIAEESVSVKKQFLGNILLDRGLITRGQLKDALAVQEMQEGHFGEILISLGYISERDVMTALVVQYHMPYIAIDQYEIDRDVIDLIPEEIARKNNIIPLDRVNNILSLVMVNPLDSGLKGELMRMTHCRIASFLATLGEIENAINRGYDR